MQITDCKNKNVKISKGSITVKDENGKTRGVVRDIRHFHDIQANKQHDYWMQLKRAGLWGNSRIDIEKQIVIDSDGKMWLFRNIHGIESLKKFDSELLETLNGIYETAQNNGIDVIECDFV